ncbi:MAG: hypothetical protein MRY71_13325 [Algiphilus sp.]|nr:hypothetical protein [Algiphilus sp.]
MITNAYRTLLLSTLLLLGACGGSEPPSTGAAPDDDGTDTTPDATAPSSASLAGCLLDAKPAQCADGLMQLGGLGDCPPSEEGLNCAFNTVYDAVGVGRLTDAAGAALAACPDSPAAPICALLATMEPIPDALPLATDTVPRGDLVVVADTTDPAPAGRWAGTASRLGGTAHYSRGEHIYNDYVFDAWGADDGDDARRLAATLLLGKNVARTERLDQLFQAVGSQFGLPRPLGAAEHYGDALALADGTDLLELRWGTQPSALLLQARYVRLLEAERARLLLLVDSREGAGMQGLDLGLHTQRFDRAVLIDAAGITVVDLLDGSRDTVASSVDIDLDAMTLETRLPRALLTGPDGQLRVAAVTLGTAEDGTDTIANVAYRFDEPVAGLYNERGQALSLLAGTIDRYATRIDLAAMDAGLSQDVRPGPGYHERQFDSGANISDRTSREDGPVQHYGLYIPPDFAPEAATPLSIWLHYRGGKAHNGAAWTPRLIRSYGDRHGQIVVTPRGRGTSTWYVSRAHQDFFEVFGDVHALLPNIDPRRRYLSGYSMGGYGTYLFGLLYPDLFAAGYSTSGALTQGAWTGVGPDSLLCGGQEVPVPGLGDGNACFIQANGGDADAQLSWRLLENARHLPLAIHHGTTDYLVPITGITRVGERLTRLGYRHDVLTFLGYEHFTQAILDEWRDGADYMAQFTAPENPRRVTYRISPALVRAVNTIGNDGAPFDFDPDGAWWVSDMQLHDDNPDDTANHGRIDAISEAIAAPAVVALPRTGIDQGSTPVVAPLGHSTPFVRTGLDWLEIGTTAIANAFSVDAENLAAASLDIARMQLDATQPIAARIRSDAPMALTMKALTGPLTACSGNTRLASGTASLQLELPAGETPLRLLPGENRTCAPS